jgi:hypothetical protein
MGLPDIAGVLSRYFVVGFFLPVFFTLMILSQALSAGFPLPAVYEDHSEGVRVLIVGGAALLLGLLLSGFRYVIDSTFAGLFLLPRPGSTFEPYLRPWTWLVLLPQRLTYRRHLRHRDSPKRPGQQQPAAWHLDRRYPQQEGRLLPTSYGNTMRATADYAWSRWRLDLEAVEERIALLMSDGERELHMDARTDLAFFVNSSLGAFAILGLLIADQVSNQPLAWKPAIFVFIATLVAAVLFYAQAVNMLERLGRLKRASIDLHRHELYAKLGLERPVDFTDERALNRAVNQALLWGSKLPDYRAAKAEPAERS